MKEVSIGFQVQYEHFIDFDEDCGLCVQFFGDMFDEALLEGKQELDYQFLYNMAHEFNRYSELAREAAMLIEGSSSSLEDMYGLDSGDLD